MKKFLFMLVALMATFFTVNAFAFTPPPPPDHGWYVVDQAGVLSQTQISNLNRRIEAVNKATKNEFGVLTLANMNGEDIESVTNATYNAWGIGKRGLNNGVLIVIAMKEHKWRIEIGKGAEGDVTDLQASDVGTQQLVPFLRKGDVAGGLMNTINTLDSLMETRINAKVKPAPIVNNTSPVVNSNPIADTPNPEHQDSSVSWLIIVIGIVAVIGAGVLFASYFYSKKEEEERRQAELALQREAKRRRAEEEYRRLNEEKQRQHDIEMRSLGTARKQAEPVVPSVKHTQSVTKVPVHYEPVHQNAVDLAAAATLAAAEVERQNAARARQLEQEARLREQERDRQDRAREQEARLREQERERRERDREREEERRAREREREEEDRRRRDEEDRRRRDEDSSSSISIPSFDWGSGGSDSGSGFGGGSSDGGGASGDW